MQPASITMILSQSMMVFRRWAMVMTVHSANLVRIVSWISESVLEYNTIMFTANRWVTFASNGLEKQDYWLSMLAVASSKTRIRLFFKMALAKHISCLWPMLKLLPLRSTFWSRTKSVISTWWRLFHSCSSLCTLKGSKLLRTVSEKRNGCWGMMDIFERNSCKPSWLNSNPSILICPCIPSGNRRNRVDINDDLPAPVLPTTPIFHPASIVTFRFWNSFQDS